MCRDHGCHRLHLGLRLDELGHDVAGSAVEGDEVPVRAGIIRLLGADLHLLTAVQRPDPVGTLGGFGAHIDAALQGVAFHRILRVLLGRQDGFRHVLDLIFNLFHRVLVGAGPLLGLHRLHFSAGKGFRTRIEPGLDILRQILHRLLRCRRCCRLTGRHRCRRDGRLLRRRRRNRSAQGNNLGIQLRNGVSQRIGVRIHKGAVQNAGKAFMELCHFPVEHAAQ